MLDDAAYGNDAAATSGTVSFASPVLTWTGNLAPGGTATVTFTVTVNNPDTGDKALAAAAASTAAGSSCPPGSGSAGCDITVPVLTPALTITTAASPATATPGQKVTYTITVTNTGQTPYAGATFTAPLSGLTDDAAYGNDATATAGTVSFASPSLTWTGNLNPGQAATITYTVTVNNPDTGDHTLTATVTSATPGSNCPAASTDPRCTTTTPIAGLTIVNTANASTAIPGSTIAYTITITNTGQVPYDGATVTDDLTGVTDDAAYGNDAAATAGTVSFASPNLTWTGDLAPGQAATITFSVTVHNPDTGDKSLTSTITSAAAGSTCPASGPAPACTSAVTVLTPALTITKAASTTTTTPGATVGYTVTVTDTGPTPYTAATVTDALGSVMTDAVYDGDAAATTGTVSLASSVLTWTGNLTPGQAATITYSVTVKNPDTGDKRLVNTVSSDTMGSTCPPGSGNPACTTTVTDLIPALTITKTASTTTATPGSTVGYTVTVTDTGQTPYTGATVADDLGGVMNDAVYDNDVTATAGTVSFASPNLTWTGNLTPGQAATIRYTVTVDNPDTGGHGVLANTVTSAVPGSNCPAGSTNPGCAVTVAVVAGPLTITAPATASLGSVAPGGTLRSDLGTVQVTDDRGFGASWTATVSSTGFATGTGTESETIPAGDAQYDITALTETSGPATFTPVPVTQLSASPQAVVSATNVAGNTSVSWDPAIEVNVPANAISGGYTATITHSVS
jgi:uncharacterized repeat protein (TIGR01451 family)